MDLLVYIALALAVVALITYLVNSKAKSDPKFKRELDAAKAKRAKPAPKFGTKTVQISQYSFTEGRTNVQKKLAPYIADGWEVVSEDVKKYGTGGKHSVLLRRAVD